MSLIHRHPHRLAEGGAGGGEDHGFHAGRPRSLYQGDRAADIVVEEGAGVLYRLADLDAGGEVHDDRRPVLGEHGVQTRPVPNVALLERSPLDVFGVAIGEVIDHGREPRLRQGQTGVGADIAAATN